MSAQTWTRERVLLLAPALVLLFGIVGIPVLRVLFLSFAGSDLEAGPHWVGLDAYQRLWQDGRWWAALRNTAWFSGASVALEMVLGLAFALVLHQAFPGRGLVRALVLLPWALPTAVMGLAWAWIFNDSFGVANDLLIRSGLLSEPVAWLGRPRTAMLAMIVADVWKNTPFVALVLLAGLQSIPGQVLDAAQVDGLSARQRLFRVVLPMLGPSLLVALAFRMVQAYGAFDIAYAMTGGGPGGSTETVSLFSFENYFRYLDFGYGSAAAVQGAIFAVAIVVAARLGARRWGSS